MTSVVIVGGGVVGLSAAVHLRRLDGGARVTVLERERVGAGASGSSAAGIGALGRPPEVVPLALESVGRWPELARELEAETGYRRGGGLLLAVDDRAWAGLAALAARARASGVDAELVDGAAAARLAPGITTGARGGVFAASSGQAEAPETTRAFAAAARRLGARLEEGVGVCSLAIEGGRVAGVLRGDGRRAVADAVIVAAGAWSGPLLAAHGVDLPLQAGALQALLSAKAASALGPVLGASGKAVTIRQRADGAYLIGGGWPAEIEDVAGNRCRPLAERVAANVALAREIFPALQGVPLARTWAGIESFSSDGLPILGPVPGISGLVLAAGWSGHGFALAPAAGEVLARLALGLDPRAALWEQLRADRFA